VRSDGAGRSTVCTDGPVNSAGLATFNAVLVTAYGSAWAAARPVTGPAPKRATAMAGTRRRAWIRRPNLDLLRDLMLVSRP